MNTCRYQGGISGTATKIRFPVSSCAGLMHRRELKCNALLNFSPRRSRISKTRNSSIKAATAAVSTTAVSATGASPLLSIVAVIVGWLVIAGSLFRSVPQIARIIKKQSAIGLSFTSIISELIAYVITVAYNVRFSYPFSTWGDILMVTVQQIAIVALVFKYNKSTRLGLKITTVVGFLAASAFLFSSEFCSIATLKVLQGCSALIMALGGRLPQIILNFRRGNSGELSGASTGLSVAGNLARVFTTLTLVGDPLILATASSQLVLNSIVLYQILDTARREKEVLVAAATR
ncbi:hypothetical protein Ndes2526B_g03298 [Nannochloris sp. 'desiccata']